MLRHTMAGDCHDVAAFPLLPSSVHSSGQHEWWSSAVVASGLVVMVFIDVGAERVTTGSLSSVVLPGVDAYSDVGLVCCDVIVPSLVIGFLDVDAGIDVAVNIITTFVSEYVLMLKYFV